MKILDEKWGLVLTSSREKSEKFKRRNRRLTGLKIERKDSQMDNQKRRTFCTHKELFLRASLENAWSRDGRLKSTQGGNNSCHSLTWSECTGRRKLGRAVDKVVTEANSHLQTGLKSHTDDCTASSYLFPSFSRPRQFLITETIIPAPQIDQTPSLTGRRVKHVQYCRVVCSSVPATHRKGN
jgi:hypothetical protein